MLVFVGPVSVLVENEVMTVGSGWMGESGEWRGTLCVGAGYWLLPDCVSRSRNKQDERASE